MKVFFHKDFYEVYTSDPAAAEGRMEAVVTAIQGKVEFIEPQRASEADILLAHTEQHVQSVKKQGLFPIAALAAGAAIETALEGLQHPCFGLIRPPGHHASSGSAWGFCYFSNMAIAMLTLQTRGVIKRGYILDIDMHFGDGTTHILKENNDITVHNIETEDRKLFMQEVEEEMSNCTADLIGISAGFDNHVDDWGGVLITEDYTRIGQLVRKAAKRNNGGCFGILEGGYNHTVLGDNVLALIEGLST